MPRHDDRDDPDRLGYAAEVLIWRHLGSGADLCQGLSGIVAQRQSRRADIARRFSQGFPVLSRQYQSQFRGACFEFLGEFQLRPPTRRAVAPPNSASEGTTSRVDCRAEDAAGAVRDLITDCWPMVWCATCWTELTALSDDPR